MKETLLLANSTFRVYEGRCLKDPSQAEYPILISRYLVGTVYERSHGQRKACRVAKGK
jgi:hypothetical protein